MVTDSFSGVSMEFKLDKSSKVKLYHQLYQIFVGMIESGELKVGSKIPSIRILSDDYGISRNTVTKTYGELEKDGYIYSLSKSGFYVRNPKEQLPPSIKKQEPADIPEKEEEDEIPTVNSLLKNSMATKEDPGKELLQTNLDADIIQKKETLILKDTLSVDEFSQKEIDIASEEICNNDGNKECSLLMNSGDIVQSRPVKEVILSPIQAFIDSCITALAEHHNRIEGDKKVDIQGEAPLRIAIAAFIYKFHNIDINPTQIILGSNIAYSVFHLLQLEEFRNPSKYVHGLLQLAQNSISTDPIEPLVAYTADMDNGIVAAFKAAGFKAVKVDMETTEEQVKKLEEVNATVFLTSTKVIKSKKLSKQDQAKFFSWLKGKEYRYLFEYDNCVDPYNFKNVENYSVKERVVYINSFSTLISKSINTAFLFIPRNLVPSYKEKFENFGSPLSMIDQCGLIDFLIKGKLYNYLTNLEQL